MLARNLALLIFILGSPAAVADRDAALRAYEQRDFATAIKEWQVLADKGDAEAQFRLGAMYEHGEGVPAQANQAANWYRKAAEQAYPHAQYALGIQYSEGRGVPQDYIEAHKWLNLAAANGEADAAKQRDKVADKMTPAQIAEAQRLAREWKPMSAQHASSENVFVVPELFRVGGGVSAPVVLYKVDPNYSEEARKAWLDGSVTLKIVVDSTGQPRDISVTQSLGLGLDEKAVETVNTWKFRPGYRSGKPVAVFATVNVNFHLMETSGWLLTRALFEIPDGVSRPIFTKFAHPKTHDYKGTANNSSVLHFEVDANGIPRNFRFTVPPQPEISNDLIEAVKKWRFTPAQKEGSPVAANATFEFSFRPAPLKAGRRN